ncbi:MAG: hypothetical protein WA705_29515 [Candidatus Ozemobacteraceae bacterium]
MTFHRSSRSGRLPLPAILSLLSLLLVFSTFNSTIPASYALNTSAPLAICGTANSPTSGTSKSLSQRADDLLGHIGDAFLKKLPIFVDRLNSGKKVSLTTTMAFYDAKLRRIFVAFKGSAIFTGHLPQRIEDLADRVITSDSDIAWDFSVSHLKNAEGVIAFDFEGDVVIFLDKVMLSIAHTTAEVAGGLAFRQAGEALLSFVTALNPGALANAITKTFATFSKDALATTGQEMLQNAAFSKNKKLSELIREGARSGGMLEFMALSVLHASFSGVAQFTGATIGAAVGNILVPGAGAFAGALIGQKIVGAVAKTVVHKLSVDLPIEIALRRICKSGEALKENSGDQIAREKMSSAEALILKKLKREFDNSYYETLDKLMHHIDGLDAVERPYLTTLLKRIYDLLVFKVTDKGDWYSAKKYNQLKVKCAFWGIKI